MESFIKGSWKPQNKQILGSCDILRLKTVSINIIVTKCSLLNKYFSVFLTAKTKVQFIWKDYRQAYIENHNLPNFFCFTACMKQFRNRKIVLRVIPQNVWEKTLTKWCYMKEHHMISLLYLTEWFLIYQHETFITTNKKFVTIASRNSPVHVQPWRWFWHLFSDQGSQVWLHFHDTPVK